MTAPRDEFVTAHAPMAGPAKSIASLAPSSQFNDNDASSTQSPSVQATVSSATAPSTTASDPRLPQSDAGLLAVSSTGSLGGGAGGSTNSGGSSKQNRTLYLGNLHPFITEAHLRELFNGLMGITELKVIKDKATGVSAGYGFAKFTDQAFAQVALERVNKMVLFGQEIRVNWAFLKEQPEEVAALVHAFVGDLAPDVTDAVLLAAFQPCPGCIDARVQWDHATGRSRGYGFVSFSSAEEAETGIATMHGQFVGSRRVRCGWAQHKTDAAIPADSTILDRLDPTNTNIYVGNLSPALSDAEIRRHFATFGQVAEVKIHRKGGFGFVRYKAHEDAVRAIAGMNGATLAGKQLKCSWGRHPNTPPSGMQASLMLAAAAGIGPLAVPQGGGGGILPQMGSYPLPSGNVMGMPMAGNGGAGVIAGGGVGVGGPGPQGAMHALTGNGVGGDALGGVMPLEHLYGGGAPSGYAMAPNQMYSNMAATGQMFFPGQTAQ